MIRPTVSLFTHALLFAVLAQLAPTASAQLVRQTEAERVGLTRAWFTQGAIDSSRHTVAGVAIHGDVLYVLSSASNLQAIDTNTGQSLWSLRVGDSRLPAHGPSVGLYNSNKKADEAAKEKVGVAIVNGSSLYIVDHETGREFSERVIKGAPAGAPVLSANHCFVTLFNGQLHGYPIDETAVTIWRRSTSGTVYNSPSIAGSRVFWSTDRGELFGARLIDLVADFKLSGVGQLVAPAASLGDHGYFASEEGFLYAINAERGHLDWRASVGASLEMPPLAIGGVVYQSTHEPALHAFDASTGAELWVAPGVVECVARSNERLYALNDTGALMVLDAATGELIDRLTPTGDQTAVANNQTDRIFLVTPSGLIQCLHETGLQKPLSHTGAPVEEAAEEQPSPEPAAEDPFAEPAEDGDFGAEEEPFEPAEPEDSPAEDDPFDDPFADF